MSMERQLQRGSLVTLDGSLHRVLALLDPDVLLATVHDHRIYLVQGDDGTIALPTTADLEELRQRGRLREIGSPPPDDNELAIERMRTELDMLHSAHVPEGTKAIYLFMRTQWTNDLRNRFGPHDDPATLRRWYAASKVGS